MWPNTAVLTPHNKPNENIQSFPYRKWNLDFFFQFFSTHMYIFLPVK